MSLFRPPMQTFTVTLLKKDFFLGIIRRFVSNHRGRIGDLHDHSYISNHDTETMFKKLVALGILISLFIAYCTPDHMDIPCNINK
ncbi:hypothetical protein cypCar_00004256 [Cyprinus carpio]|nr:hypothetical protein cypCar_00004256 [Cyprinus carpio]